MLKKKLVLMVFLVRWDVCSLVMDKGIYFINGVSVFLHCLFSERIL